MTIHTCAKFSFLTAAAKQKGQVRRGVKEVTKALRKGESSPELAKNRFFGAHSPGFALSPVTSPQSM